MTFLGAIWQVKVRLQHTGWLQYLVPALASVPLALASLALPPLRFVAYAGFAVTAHDILRIKYQWFNRGRIKRSQKWKHATLPELIAARRSCRSFIPIGLRSDDLHEVQMLVQAAMADKEVECGGERAQMRSIELPARAHSAPQPFDLNSCTRPRSKFGQS